MAIILIKLRIIANFLTKGVSEGSLEIVRFLFCRFSEVLEYSWRNKVI